MALGWGRPLWRALKGQERSNPWSAGLISSKAGVFPHENGVSGNHHSFILRRIRRDGANADASLSESSKSSGCAGPGPERNCAASPASNKLRQHEHRQAQDRKMEDRLRAKAAVTADSRFVAEEHRQCHAGAYQ